ncbi:GPI-anchored surface protein, putative [Bodo saltans]|uniref:GPI-anchored surface protein, putative n=1 Tax=Bodo saltans TaxID=75058 RepID=A0A0S4JVN5_BODSA|nr:GPI-anchored surface protein, putative [Bodo saltans]|eukprot:CUG94305.1 GPI-anchored surface protein, putative [Bodo saltans]
MLNDPPLPPDYRWNVMMFYFPTPSHPILHLISCALVLSYTTPIFFRDTHFFPTRCFSQPHPHPKASFRLPSYDHSLLVVAHCQHTRALLHTTRHPGTQRDFVLCNVSCVPLDKRSLRYLYDDEQNQTNHQTQPPKNQKKGIFRENSTSLHYTTLTPHGTLSFLMPFLLLQRCP